MPLPKSESGSKDLENILSEVNSALYNATSFAKPRKIAASSADSSEEAAAARQVTSAVNLTSRIVSNHSLFNILLPKAFNELTVSVRTLSNNSDNMMRTFVDNNRQFQNALIAALTGEKIATSSAGAKTKLAKRGVVGASRLASNRLAGALRRKRDKETEDRLEAEGREDSLLNKDVNDLETENTKTEKESSFLGKSASALNTGLQKTIKVIGAEELATAGLLAGSIYLLKSYEEKQAQIEGEEEVKKLDEKFPGFKEAFDKLSPEDLKKPEVIENLKGQFPGLFDGVPPLKIPEQVSKLTAAKGGTGTKVIDTITAAKNLASKGVGAVTGAAKSMIGGGSTSSSTPSSLPKGSEKDVQGAGGVVKVSGNLTTLRTKSGKSYQVATRYAKNFAGFVSDLEAAGYKVRSIGGYANRNIAGTGRKSIHAYGAAIDINPTANPVTYGAKGRSPTTDMPANVNALANKWGLGWGGKWRGSKQDAMHFSIAEGPGALLSRRQLEQGGGDVSTPATRSYSIPSASSSSRTVTGGTSDTKSGGGIKSVAEMVKLAKEAGFNDQDASIMGAIGAAESSGNPKAHNPKGRDNSYGLWQINMLGDMGPDRRRKLGIDSNEKLWDPKINARAAYMIYKHEKQGFRAWSVYTSGKYKQFLGTAQSALKGSGVPVASKPGASDLPGSVPAGTPARQKAAYNPPGSVSSPGSMSVVGGSISALGKQLQQMGLHVSEHPAFGGVRSRHSRNGGHYDGRAIDINAGSGVVEANSRKWGPIFDGIAASARAKGFKVIWRAGGHYNHMHIASPRGGLAGDPNAKTNTSPVAPGGGMSAASQKQAMAAHARARSPQTTINNNRTVNRTVIVNNQTKGGGDAKSAATGNRTKEKQNNKFDPRSNNQHAYNPNWTSPRNTYGYAGSAF